MIDNNDESSLDMDQSNIDIINQSKEDTDSDEIGTSDIDEQELHNQIQLKQKQMEQ